MKKLFTVLGLLLAMSSQTFAADSECTHAVGTVKKGYSLNQLHLALNGAFAMLKVPGEAAARKLKCVMPLRANHPRCFDCPRTVASCSDSGYSIVITGGGITGKKFALIQAKNRRALINIGQFRCEAIPQPAADRAHGGLPFHDEDATVEEVSEQIEE